MRSRVVWTNLLLAVGSPILVFGGLELLLTVIGVEPTGLQEDPYVGFSSRVELFEPQPASDGRTIMRTARSKSRLFNDQEFLRQKPDGTYRIFCLGGSTTFGRPYDDATSFCGWLRELLAEVDPSRRWEVINAGGISYASYRSAIVMEELLSYEPDLFLVYSGHNEFLEDRTYSTVIATPPAIRGLGALASRTRTYSVVKSAISAVRGTESVDQIQRTILDAEVRTLLDSSVGPEAYVRDDSLRDRILEHYRFNLARMVDMARSVGAEVIVITPAGNLRHSSPFKSEASEKLSDQERSALEQFLASAATSLAEKRPAEALDLLDEAVGLDPRYAQTLFLRGRALDALARFPEAKAAYEAAREEDVCPLRALAATRQIILELAAERRIPLVDFAGLVEETAPEGIPGEETFFDHVHPQIPMNRALALSILNLMQAEGVVDDEAIWDDTAVERVERRVGQRLEPEGHGRALLNLSKVLGWAGKLEEAARLAELAIQQAPDLPEPHYQAGQCALLTGRNEDAIRHYRRSLELAPRAATTHGNLAVALEREGRTLEAVLHYRRAIALLGNQESPYRTSLIESLARLGATP